MYRVTEQMFSSGRPIAQGEVLIWLKKYAPKRVLDMLDNGKAQPMKLEQGELILGHSETGHHHVLRPVDKSIPLDLAALALVDPANDAVIDLTIKQECEIIHLRSFDTHEGYILPPGDYVRLIREEQTPDGWRRVAD